MKDSIDTKYDGIHRTELQKRLNRVPLASEIINADNDSDLVNEALWQLVTDLDARLTVLERGK